jgi:O-antigen/teichoic acid export membrane protein/glycosyltransferase involved in cell wall biosynthesis
MTEPGTVLAESERTSHGSRTSSPLGLRGLKGLMPAGVVGGGGIALLVATVVANGTNLGFNIVISRLLGAERYGALGSIIGFLTVFAVLTSAIQLAVAQGVAEGLKDAVGLRLRKPVLAAAGSGLVAFLVAAVFAPILQSFLHLRSLWLVVLLGLVLAPTVAATVPAGVLLGRQRYGIVGGSFMLAALGRFVFGIIMVRVGLGVSGALAASLVGQLLAYAMLLWPLHREIKRGAGGEVLPTRLGIATLSTLALSGLSAFTAVDSILARHYLTPVSAGHYVAAATAARIALFAPGAVSLVVFPRFAAASWGERAERRLLAEALVVTAILSVGAAVVLIALPHLAIAVLFGRTYESAVPILRVLAIAGATLGVISLLIYYHQARSSAVAACSWLGVVAAAIVIVLSEHGSSIEIAWTMVATSLSVLGLALVTAFWRPPSINLEAATDSKSEVNSSLYQEPSLDITMVVPYYNPGPRFVPNLAELIESLGSSAVTFEVIAVSDGSTDGFDAGFELQNSDMVRRVNLGKNQGKGQALRVGLSRGRGRYLGFIDADGDIPAVQVKHLVEIMERYRPDIVLGSKRHPLSEVRYPPIRRLYSWGYQQIVRTLFHLKLRDSQTGLKLVRRQVLADVLPLMLEKRFAFDLELLVLARRLGYRRFFEVPVKIQERFSSTVRPSAVWPMLLDTLAIFYRLRILRFYEHRRAVLRQDTASSSFGPLAEVEFANPPEGPVQFPDSAERSLADLLQNDA